MTEVTENRYAIVGLGDDPTGRLDVVELLRMGDRSCWVRYDGGHEAPVDAVAVISRDATPDRLLKIKASLDEFWVGAEAAMGEARSNVNDTLDALSADTIIDVPKTKAALNAHWTGQRQSLWSNIIGQMREQPVLAPEAA